MFALQFRKLIDTPFSAVARQLVGSPVNAITLTVSGFAAGLVAFGCVATHRPLMGLAFLLLNGVLAALARSLAGLDAPAGSWVYLDLVLEFLLGASMPLAFAVADPSRALAAAFLVLGLAGVATARLAHDVVAARRSLLSAGRKIENFLPVDRAAILIAFAVACVIPAWFSVIAYVAGVLSFVLMGIRVANAVESLT
jgi:hypothetical protein